MKKSIFLVLLSICFVACSKDEDNSPEEELPEVVQLVAYEGVALKLTDSADSEMPIAYSAETGKVYTEAEAEANIASIDIVTNTNQAFINFESPDSSDFTKGIMGSRNTKIQHTQVEITEEEFATLTIEQLTAQTVTHDNEAKSIADRSIILFETASGTKGAIYVKALNAERILFDIKQMK